MSGVLRKIPVVLLQQGLLEVSQFTNNFLLVFTVNPNLNLLFVEFSSKLCVSAKFRISPLEFSGGSDVHR